MKKGPALLMRVVILIVMVLAYSPSTRATGSDPRESIVASKPEYRFPCKVDLSKNWRIVRESKTDQQLLDEINTSGLQAHPTPGAIDLSRTTDNKGPRTYGICEDRNVYTAIKGKVVDKATNVKNGTGFGWYVKMENAYGQSNYYGHLLGPSQLKVGETYEQGTFVGVMGCTGNTRDCGDGIVHFDTWVGPKRVDNWQFKLPVPPCPQPTPSEISLYSSVQGGTPDRCGGKGAEGHEGITVPPNGSVSGSDLHMPLGSVVFPKSCPAPSLPLDATQQYRLKSTATGLFADVEGASQADRAPVILWSSHGHSNQRWAASKAWPPDGDNYFISALNSNKCLSADPETGAVVQYECFQSGTAYRQVWHIVPVNDKFLLIEEVSGRALSAAAGRQLTIAPYVPGPLYDPNQLWEISRLDTFLAITNARTQVTGYFFTDQPDLKSSAPWLGVSDSEFFYSVGRFNNACGAASKASGSSTQVTSCVPNSAPNAPLMLAPATNYTVRDTAPTLCWQNQGDPDNNPLEFQVEIYDSPVNLTSGWITNTCWRPAQLDRQYHTYQWRVKARDALLAESAWSETRQFTIQSPNNPPAVALTSVNGNSATSILSRERDWTFTGTASDPEGQLNRVEWHCTGDGCGTTVSHTDGVTWSHTQTGMWGRNRVYFTAYDNYGNATDSRHVTLNIDLAPPVTMAALNGEAYQVATPTRWYTGTVAVRLSAEDGRTGSAAAGVRELHYRVDGGPWQTQTGAQTGLNVDSDGEHSIEYYAIDQVGNQEEPRRADFRIDQTPPGPPGEVVEVGGAEDDVWQRQHNLPRFTWSPGNESGSGLWGSQLYFGPDPDVVAYNNFPATGAQEWTPYPSGTPTGIFYLRGRSRDNAGNWSRWTDLFTFRYDGTPPENPSGVTHTDGITSTVWQRATSRPDFHWPAAHDEGSGVQGTYVYWGSDPDGAGSELINQPVYASAVPLCSEDTACTGYLRLRSVDNVGNEADEWSTAFVLRYDNAPPSVDFGFEGGSDETAQTQVVLDIHAEDAGSGVIAMRFSMDGREWMPWEAYAPKRTLSIPAIGRQWWPVYVQVKDGVELESTVATHSIYLEVNRDQPRSVNFRLFDDSMDGGAGTTTSAAYTSHSTVGQIANTPAITSTGFSLQPGYEAGSRAVPVVDPGYETFQYKNGLAAAGGAIMSSTSFRLKTNVGELGLPAGITTLTSEKFGLQPGLLAAEPSLPEPLPTPEPGPPPPPEEALPCEIPSVSINNGEAFTKQLPVTLSICAPHAVEMMLGNTENLDGAVWEHYATARAWMLSSEGGSVTPRFVYAAFKDADGNVNRLYMDDIVYDPTLPEVELLVGDTVSTAQGSGRTAGGQLLTLDRTSSDRLPNSSRPIAAKAPVGADGEEGGVVIYINGMDDNSGLATMEFSASPVFTDTVPEPYAPIKNWVSPDGDGEKSLYARFTDGAGNASQVQRVDFIYDTLPPFGWVSFSPDVVSAEAVTVTARLVAADGYIPDEEYEQGGYVGTVTDVRWGADPELTEAFWQPYTDTVTVSRVISDTAPFTLYAQFRDLAGNVSDVYSGTYTVDSMPPELHVSVQNGETLARTLDIFARDESASLETMRLSNDPLMVEDVVTVPYTTTVQWTFDDRRVVWVQVSDSVQNWSQPQPAYAAEAASAQAPIVTGALDDTGVQLAWTHVDPNVRYEVWRSQEPHFSPAEPGTTADKLGEVYPEGATGLSYVDLTADPNVSYYYVVLGFTVKGQSSVPSNYIGVVRYRLQR